MKDKREQLSVLILTDMIDIGSCIEDAVTMLGHKPDWNSYARVSDIQSAVEIRAWDLVVIEGCHCLENLAISSIDLSPMKLRLLCEDGRIAIIAARTMDTHLSPEAEWLVIALSRLLRHIA
jgi:hypothetical protein